MESKFISSQDSLVKILSKYDITNFSFKESFDGIENTTIFVFAKNQNFVLRVYRSGVKTDEQIQTEIDFIYFLRENDFHTPDIFANVDDELLTKVTIDKQEWQVILMEKIYGQPVPVNEWVKDDNLVKNMAQTQAKLHILGSEYAQINLKNDYETNICDSGVGKTLTQKLSQLQASKDFSPEIQSILSSIKSLEPEYNPFLPLGYIHDDIDWNNLILDENNELYVIDFGDLRVGPLVSCLGSGVFSTILCAFELGLDIRTYSQKYLDFYAQVRAIESDELIELKKPLILTIDLYIVSELSKSNQLNTKIENFLRLKNEILQLVFKEESVI